MLVLALTELACQSMLFCLADFAAANPQFQLAELGRVYRSLNRTTGATLLLDNISLHQCKPGWKFG